MTRRRSPRSLLALSLLLILGASVTAAAETTRPPHIVILLADDLGWNDVGFHGAPIETPNIDSIAREGVELDRFYAQPICTPTRAALLTGRSPLRSGLAFGVVRPWDYFGLPTDEILLSEALQDAGYQTAIVGKWHLGHSHVRQTPNRRGFDHFYGHLLGALDYYTHSRFGGHDWQRNGEPLQEEGYATDLLGAEAARVIATRDRSKPLFVYVPFNAPHSPLQAPPALVERYAALSSEPNRRAHAAFIEGVAARLGLSIEEAAGILDPAGEAPRAVFAAMVHSLDLAIGRILAALDEEDMAEDTLVLFFSDNGGHLALGASNLPLRGEKSTVFEGGIRVPAAMRWPAGLKGGRRVSQTISVQDVMPTLLSAAGVAPMSDRPLDGVDRWAQIRGADPVAPGEIFFGVNGVVGRQEALRFGRWKLVRALGFEGDVPEIMLFDVEADPSEKRNLATAQPERVLDLVARLDRWVRLDPPGGAQGVHWPHPGWVPPRDYGAAVRHDPPVR
ncbi:MAG: sulfatase-like hydrolase/transferase [Deltaproteobacteria bacterium]|jgi:arylsulfatase A-like enzyme|nr:sulfatase-like hydrolase/transferase [Deltaproteobacteria bacterium]